MELEQKRKEEDADNFGPKMIDAMTAEEKIANQSLQMARELGAWHKQKAEETSASMPDREEWMTALPVEFKQDPLDIKNRKFAMGGVEKRGDTTAWTDTPAQLEAKRLEAMRMQAEREGRHLTTEEKKAWEEHQNRMSANASPEEAQAMARALEAAQNGVDVDGGELFGARSAGGTLNDRTGGKAAVEEEETEAQKKKRLFKEFKAWKREEKRERKERIKAFKEAEATHWDRDKAFTSMRGMKTEKERKREIQDAGKLMGNFVGGDSQNHFM